MASKSKVTAAKPSLRDKMWTTQLTALRDLKAAGMTTRGADYELREVNPMEWRLVALADGEDGPAQAAPDPAPQPPPKPAARPAKSVATDPAVIARTAASRKKGKASATDRPDELPVTELVNISDEHQLPVPGWEEPAAPKPAQPLAGVTCRDVLFIIRGTPAAANAYYQTLELIKKLGTVYAIEVAKPVELEVLGTFDWASRLAARASIKATTRAGAPRKAPGGPGRGVNPDSKNARATALLTRPGGATAAEIAKATGWDVGQRHINRLAKLSGRPIEQIKDKHWRLGEPT